MSDAQTDQLLIMATVDHLKNRIDHRLNDHLCEMKEGWDDSIIGFNDAWDIVRASFKEAIDAGTLQVRRPSSAEPVPPSPFQAAVLEEALERIMTEPVDYICCGNYQPGNHPEDGPQCCGSPESTHEQIAAEALSRYRATPGQG